MAGAVRTRARAQVGQAAPDVQRTLFDLDALEPEIFARAAARRKSYGRISDVEVIPSLIEIQRRSFRWFRDTGLGELMAEVFPIESFNKKIRLELVRYWFEDAKYSEEECRIMDRSYAAPLYIRARLINEAGERLEQDVYMGDFPLMTENATFIINGAERVVVSQLIRSSGVYFTVQEDRTTGRLLSLAKLIPNRGAWLEFETSRKDLITVKVDRRRKIPVTSLLRALGALDVEDDPSNDLMREGTDEEILGLFSSADTMPDHRYVEATLEKDPSEDAEEGLLEFFRKMRPGDPATLDNARNYLEDLLFNPRRYDLARVGRYKLNRRLGLSVAPDHLTLTKQDLAKVVEHMILVNNGVDSPDDIDDLGNRRVKTVGELIQNQLRIGLLRMERVVRERMSTRDPEQINPLGLINIRPVVAATREFFGGSQLSQFMDQTNPLAELTHKRRLSALGPGGLRRERAGFDVRDVHQSHYGRICPIETPEGPNIGLIGSLATYADINEYGFIETPNRRVITSAPNKVKSLKGKTLRQDVADPTKDRVVAKAGTVVTTKLAKEIAGLDLEEIPIVPTVTDEIVFLPADEEEKHTIAQANAELDDKGQFVHERVSVRRGQEFLIDATENVDFMDVSPKQIVSVSAALIPFLEHDDANRALMGSNMQRQAVPLLKPESPIVGTGIEFQAARDSGQVVLAETDGEVTSVSGERVIVVSEDGDEQTYPLRRFNRSNQGSCIDQRPIVEKGQKIRVGDVLADSSSTDHGELALGRNVVVAFLSWEGGNFEDAVLINERFVRDDTYTSIHIEKHEVEARDTKLGPEEITRDIPNVGEEALKDLDEDGIIRVGADVNPGDILVGKITPKGETDLSPEEKLLRAIFGEKAREVKDSSLRLPHGEKGKVVDVKVFTRDQERDLPAGVERMVRVSIAQRRKITEGDKMAGRHGNKGVISKVVPTEDMPFLEDGTPIDLILNPLGVPGRMNLGQVLETHLGWAAERLGIKVISPVFDGAREEEIAAELARAWLMDLAWREATERAWAWLAEDESRAEDLVDDEDTRLRYISHWLPKNEYDLTALESDRVYARRSVLRQWLIERDEDADAVLEFKEGVQATDGAEASQAVFDVCLRAWLEHHDHPVKAKHSLEGEALFERAEAVSQEMGWPLPTSGHRILHDGKTGEPFDRPVTVGNIYMLKLAHLVEDKVHARSTGPYSLVTQQPLGGKAQFGGQRFGEMEVWALEAYGAAHTLQEMLTIKSDDVTGRVKTYEAIVKGEAISERGLPESFRVLVKELQSLGLSVEVMGREEKWLEFGKEDSSAKPPRFGLGLMGLGRQ
ncbi:MAG: DNA-directed RNA polymerase subunit beta [Anaerolineae bacterium]